MNNKINKNEQCKHNFKYIESINVSTLYIEPINASTTMKKKRGNKNKINDGRNKETFKDYKFICQDCKKEVIINNIEVIEFIQNKFLELFEIELSKPSNKRLSNIDFIKKVWDEYPCDDIIRKHLRNMMIMNTIFIENMELSEITEDDILSLRCLVKGSFIERASLNNLVANFANEIGFKINTSKDARNINLFSKNRVFNTTNGISNAILSNFNYYIAKTRDNEYVMICKSIFDLEVIDTKKRLDDKYIKEGVKKSNKELKKEAFHMILDKYNLMYK